MCKRDVPNCTREVARCAKGTSQIAHRRSLSALTFFSYVQFGTSLLHIKLFVFRPESHEGTEKCDLFRGRSRVTKGRSVTV